MAFPFFNSFPPEIHSLILSHAAPNDRACLTLTCKYLYELNLSNELVSLSNEDDLAPLCSKSDLASRPNNPWLGHYQHRQECHDASFEEAKKRNEESGLPLPKQKRCRTNRWASHCECFSGRSKLYQRLRTWVPKGLNYCGQCDMFTRRNKSHNGRCYHGRPKPRRREPKYWTHYSRRGSFGRKLWRKWFTNHDMNHFESRLRMKRNRAGQERYSMRELEPKYVDTREVRCSH